MDEFFDLEGLVRAFVMALGVGLVTEGIAFFVLQNRQDWPQRRPVIIVIGIGMVLFLTTAIFYMWPSLVEVPYLGELSQAEAEQVLMTKRLVPDAQPQHSETEAGRVIPYSQEPVAGIKVRPGTVVQFSVSQVGAPSPRPTDGEPSRVSVSLFQPKSGDQVRCRHSPDKVYRFSVEGTSKGLSADSSLLLWVRPVDPPSDTFGWYLQRPPSNGIVRVESDGSWEGVAQIGNAQWPPHEGDVLDVAVTVADKETADQLKAEAGVVTRAQPVGIESDTASGVVVTLK